MYIWNDDLDDDYEDEEGSRRSLSSITWKDESGGDLVQYLGEQDEDAAAHSGQIKATDKEAKSRSLRKN